VLLSREYRVNLASPGAAIDEATPNRWAGEPTVYDLAAHITLRLTVEGRPDPATGYLADIRDIDALLRSAFNECRASQGRPTPAALLAAAWSAASGMGDVIRPIEVACGGSPHLLWSFHRDTHPMLRMTESFEFSASHRLHCAQLSDDENQRIFGKCNNPRGHGHNYVVDVTVEGPADSATGLVAPPGALERVVKRQVIDRFDHKHLNEDCPEFWHLNPSVENIARVVFGLLHAELNGARLASVRVWETPKTWAECRDAADAIRPPAA
jgi:6-pyruvoyltetrahydropterin/6-carboxytetrahydropterin synthase